MSAPAAGRRVLVGVGNRDRGDDGAGPAVCDAAGALGATGQGVEIWEVHADPSTLAIRWGPEDTVVVVDAVITGAATGTLHDLDPDHLVPQHLGTLSTHGIGVDEAIRLSTVLGTRPRRLHVVGIEAGHLDHGAPLSPAVRSVITEVATRALDTLASPGRG